MAKIGFIGLGHMGLPMAINLVKAGHQITGYDLQQHALKSFSEACGLSGTCLQDAVLGQDIIISMLANGQQVLQVCEGVNGIIAQAPKGSLYIDCSTIDVPTARKIHQLANRAHLLVLDAPVSGGVLGAAAGSLTIMVGGEESAFNAAYPILSCLGKKIIHTGGDGSGQAAKICNNMILGISMIAVSEAFILSKQLGLSSQKLFEVVSSSSGQCWAMTNYVPVPGVLDTVPANNDYKPVFAAAMMLKDLHLSQDAAKSMGIDTPLGALSTELYQHLIDQGFGDLDFSVIIKSLGIAE